MAELCGYCLQPAIGYARLADGTRVCHHDTRSCYNACTYQGLAAGLTPSADVPACRDEDPAHAAALAACYPDPPDYQHPEDEHIATAEWNAAVARWEAADDEAALWTADTGDDAWW